MPPREVHYFNDVDNHARGLNWYRSHFADAAPGQIVGEKTPNYLWVTPKPHGTHVPHVHQRVHRTLPEAKLIVVVREPVARALSSLRHHVKLGRVSPRLTAYDVMLGSHRHLADHLGLIDMGRYMNGIEAYLSLYDEDQTLILVYEEDVRDQPRQGLRRACSFLGLDPDHQFREPERTVARSGYSALGSRLRRWLPSSSRAHLPQLADRWLPESHLDVTAATVAELQLVYAADNDRLFAHLGRVPRGWDQTQESVVVPG